MDIEEDDPKAKLANTIAEMLGPKTLNEALADLADREAEMGIEFH